MAKYGLIGNDISYSNSPFLHSVIGNYEYELVDVNDEAALEKVLSDVSYDGFNVTIPYKETVIKYLDELDETAKSVNAVNTIKRVGNRLIGYNTDIHGVVASVGDRVRGRKCMIFGTGGAARAVAHALREQGAGTLVFVSRDPEAAAEHMPDRATIIPYSEVYRHNDTQVAVNATPIGSLASIDKSPFGLAETSPRVFSGLEFAMDLIYVPYRTKFLQDSRRLTGCKTMSGLEVLIHQAIASRNIWIDISGKAFFEKVATATIKRKILARQLNIVAIGMPGSGKSTIFRRYANEMKMPFIDIDNVTEQIMGESIETVLGEGGKGEEYFREMEQKAVLQSAPNIRTVIAAGGGSVLNPINRDLLRANGIVIYVRRPLHMLAIKGRPISQKEGIEELFNQRDRIYRKVADISIPNTEIFGTSVDKNGGKNSYGYDMKAYVFHVKTIIEKYVFDIAGNKWT